MIAVWSLWTKPLARTREVCWYSEFHHLLGWVLSFETARRHFSHTHLLTDDAGARLLVERLALPFTRVSTTLNELDGYNPGWWALGKIYAYRKQREPFVHIDADVFLWKPLPARMLSADVLAQNVIPAEFGALVYNPDVIENALGYPKRGWLPDEWTWYRQQTPIRCGEWCGIFGGNRIDFIQSYADKAWKILTDDRNRAQLEPLPKQAHVATVEEYFLRAFLEYHNHHEDSPFAGVQIEHLFDSNAEAFQPSRAQEAGFTHLVSEAKRNRFLAERMEARVRREYPESYERCRQVISDYAAAGSGANFC
jgi:hypothetical protein